MKCWVSVCYCHGPCHVQDHSLRSMGSFHSLSLQVRFRRDTKAFCYYECKCWQCMEVECLPTIDQVLKNRLTVTSNSQCFQIWACYRASLPRLAIPPSPVLCVRNMQRFLVIGVVDLLLSQQAERERALDTRFSLPWACVFSFLYSISAPVIFPRC